MEKTVDKKKKINLKAYSPVVIFLTLEVLAFVTFSFGNSFLLYSILGIVIFALLLLVSFKEIKVDGITRSAFFIFPLFVYGLITVLSNYYSNNTYIDTTTKVFIPIALTVFAASGALLSLHKTFKISTALLVIYSTLCLITLLNLCMTMSQFTPFYTFTYRDYYMYYAGQKSSVGLENIAYALVGYQFKEVTVGFYSLFPSLLLTSSIMLFFISPKKDKWRFIAYAGFTLVAFLALIFTPNTLSLIMDVLIILTILILILFSKKILPEKPIKIGIIVILSLALIGIILFFLNAQEWSWLAGYRNFIASNSVLNKIFNTNHIAKNIKDILFDMFSNYKIFGFMYSHIGQSFIEYVVAVPSNSFIFDNLMTSGFFGALFCLFGIVYGFLGLNKYLKYSNDDVKDKTLVAGLIISFFLYSLVSADVYFQTFEVTFNFIYVTGPFLIIVLLLGYVSSKGRKDYEEYMNQKEATNEAQA